MSSASQKAAKRRADIKSGKVKAQGPSSSSKGNSSSSGPTTKTSVGNETVQQTVDRAKALLKSTGGSYNPSTPAPSQARMNEIANQSFIKPEVKAAYEASLPKTTIPGDASLVQSPYTPFLSPTSTPALGDTSGAMAGTTGLSAYVEAEKKRQLQAEQTRQKETTSGFQKLMDSMTGPADARKQAQKETGINVGDYFSQQEKSIKEIESLNKEYNSVVEAKDTQIAQTHDKLASNNFINNQIAQIERNAAPKLNRLSADINAKAAVMQAQQGNFAEAQKYVNQAVTDATADNKFKYDMYSTAYEMNKDSFDRIQTIYSDAYKEQMDLAKMAYDEQKTEKDAIGSLLLKYPNAGIDIYNDSYEEALSKAGIRAGVIENTPKSSSQTNLNRALQVLGGQSSLADYTTAEQAKIRDEIWSLDAKTAGYQGQYQMSYIPEELNKEFNALKMSVAGPGLGNVTTPEAPKYGDIVDISSKEDELRAAGMNDTDIQQVQQLHYSGWSIQQIVNQYGLPTQYAQILLSQ